MSVEVLKDGAPGVSVETVVLENGHLELYQAEINLSLGNGQVEVRYTKSPTGAKLTSVRIEVSLSDLKAIAEHLCLKLEEAGLESIASDGTLKYSALTEKGRMFMTGVAHGSR